MDDITSKSLKKASSLNIHQIDAQLTIAFQKDCENLLHKFKQCQSFSFLSFSEKWREMGFSAIFQGLENLLTVQAFIENCFFVTKKFLYAEDSYMQTGAIYILYGLYYKQPIREWVKIRLIQSDVDKIDNILNYHKAMSFLDPIFIYTKMRLDNAIEYCALPQPMSLESRNQRRQDLKNDEIKIRNPNESVLNKFKNLMEEDPDLTQFKETDEEYQRLAQKYKEKLFVFPSKIGEELNKAYSETFNVKSDETSDEDHLKQTKNKAMTNSNAMYRGERKILTALDLDAPCSSK